MLSLEYDFAYSTDRTGLTLLTLEITIYLYRWDDIAPPNIICHIRIFLRSAESVRYTHIAFIFIWSISQFFFSLNTASIYYDSMCWFGYYILFRLINHKFTSILFLKALLARSFLFPSVRYCFQTVIILHALAGFPLSAVVFSLQARSLCFRTVLSCVSQQYILCFITIYSYLS